MLIRDKFLSTFVLFRLKSRDIENSSSFKLKKYSNKSVISENVDFCVLKSPIPQKPLI